MFWLTSKYKVYIQYNYVCLQCLCGGPWSLLCVELNDSPVWDEQSDCWRISDWNSTYLVSLFHMHPCTILYSLYYIITCHNDVHFCSCTVFYKTFTLVFPLSVKVSFSLSTIKIFHFLLSLIRCRFLYCEHYCVHLHPVPVFRTVQ